MSAFTFHAQQIQASNEIERCMFEQDIPFVMLLAQMQSGKTGTYLHFALKAICDDKFDRVLIVCGCSDTALREQSKDDLGKAIRSFAQLFEVSHDLRNTMEDKVTVHFGAQVSKIEDELIKEGKLIEGELSRTLIIHDESHYAQSKENIPFKQFYKKFGIENALCGDFSILRRNKYAVLNVSATPFSELISNQNVKVMEQNPFGDEIVFEEKGVVRLKTGDGYIGVGEFNNSGKIQFSSKPIKEKSHEHFIYVLRKYRNDPKYLVVRTQRAEKDRELVERIADSLGFEYQPIFGGSSEHCFKILEDTPTKTTIIHLCGKARMGQVLCKDHIAMVYEQSKSPNVDTLLQGLLGRCCGYHSNIAIDIYVSQTIKGEVSKYIEGFANNDISQQQEVLSTMTRAMNVKKTSDFDKNFGNYVQDSEGHWWEKIVPIEFTKEDLNTSNIGKKYTFLVQKNKKPPESMYTDIDIMFSEKPYLVEKNPDKDKILLLLKKGFESRRNLDSKTFVDVETQLKLNEACSNNIRTLGGIPHILSRKKDTLTDAVALGLICGKDVGYIYGFVQCEQPSRDKLEIKLSTIEKKCNYSYFACEQEDETVIVGNGAQVIRFPQESFTDPVIFENSMKNAINRTNENHENYIHGCVCSISSNWCYSGKEYKGIRLSKDHYNDSEINKIKKRLESECKVTLKLNKSRGNPGNNSIKYASISW